MVSFRRRCSVSPPTCIDGRYGGQFRGEPIHAPTSCLHAGSAPTWSELHACSQRKFFESWRAQLKWQRLKPFDKFAAMIERH